MNMDILRKWLCFVLTMVVVAFALPGNAAPQKRFSLTVSMSTTTTATFNNLSNGNSYINSMNVTTPLPVTHVEVQANLITGTTSVTPNCSTSQPCGAGTTFLISNISGIAPGTSGTLTLTVTIPADQNACSTSYTWSGMAFTGNAGNSGGGTSFLTPTGSTTATSTTSIACILQFAHQPANAIVGTTITSAVNDPNGTPVSVQALIGGSVSTSFTGQVTLTQNPASGTLTGGSTNAVAGTATFGSLSLDTLGTYTLTAAATGFTSATSNAFKIFAGVLNCGDSFASKFTDPANLAPDQPGYAQGMRNGFNKDGVSAQCMPVLYTFTNSILTDDTVSLSWDTASQPNAAFMYSMNGRLRPVETTNPDNLQPNPIGWTITPRPSVAWLNTDGSLASATSVPGNQAFVPGLACVSQKLPAPYGTLASGIDASSTQITITGVKANPSDPNLAVQYSVPMVGAPAVPAVPFPIVIANTVGGVQSTATERITATSLATQSPATTAGYTGTYTMTFNVRRGTVTEGMSTPAAHGSGYQVMSTPLPIIPNDTTTFPPPYAVNTQAQMCIAEHGFNSFSIGADGTTQLMYFTTVIDIGDGWVKGL
jgi:hypothetical protein